MKYQTRNIPWLNVIRFHKEVTRRAEEAFFALPLNNSDSSRWSSIKDFHPKSLIGPWVVSTTSISCESIARSIRGEDIGEVFIGGPCWFKWNRSFSGDWKLDWLPVIYRSVRINYDPELGYEIVPEQGNWEVSPLVYSLLDKKQVLPSKPIDELMIDLIEKAHSNSEKEGKDITDCFIECIEREIPELGKELTKQFPNDKVEDIPSSWILFIPPSTSSAFTQHLMHDYELLEKRLQDNNSDIGGLRLLEDLPLQCNIEAVDLLPIVPLNESQRNAVNGILKSKPVTVISGPPGCGKSQVVISLLLNAWAKGISVMFGSNNNQAVDVVRERLERFESDFPIAIRAGARKFNNIEDALRRTLNIISSGSNVLDQKNKSSEQKRNQLTEEQRDLQKFLDSQIPQRIDQAVKSALNGYASYNSILEEIKQKIDSLQAEINKLGYNINLDKFSEIITIPLRKWVERVSYYKDLIQQDDILLSDLRLRADQQIMKRDLAAGRVGLEAQLITSWKWLVNGPSPELVSAWLESFKSFLIQPIENRIEHYEWIKEYEQWNNEEDASDWSKNARSLSEEVRRTCGELLQKITEIDTLKIQYEDHLKNIVKLGIPSTLAIDKRILDQWISDYASETTLPKSKMDWWPWSKRRKLLHKLNVAENIMKSAFPLTIWKEVGELNRTGREVLSDRVERSREWIDIRNLWNEKEPIRNEIENKLRILRGKAFTLRSEEIPTGDEVKAWLELANKLEKNADVADQASLAWNKRKVCEETKGKLREIAHQFQSLGPGIPIKESWIKGIGSDFVKSILALMADPIPADVITMRSALYSDSIETFHLNPIN